MRVAFLVGCCLKHRFYVRCPTCALGIIIVSGRPVNGTDPSGIVKKSHAAFAIGCLQYNEKIHPRTPEYKLFARSNRRKPWLPMCRVLRWQISLVHIFVKRTHSYNPSCLLLQAAPPQATLSYILLKNSKPPTNHLCRAFVGSAFASGMLARVI